MGQVIMARRGSTKELLVSVIGGTVQPSAVPGNLWVNTSTPITKWVFFMAQPWAGYEAVGDVWIQMSDSGSGWVTAVSLPTKLIIIRVLRVKQWNGTAWVSRNAYFYDGASWTQISATFYAATDISYTGTKEFIDEGNGHWKVRFLTSGNLTFLSTPDTTLDIFLLGGGSGGAGGAGTYHNFGGSGGGGGYTLTQSNVGGILSNTAYQVIVGAGGAGSAVNGGNNAGGASSIAFGGSVSGGAGINGGSGGASSMFQAVGSYGGTDGGAGQNRTSAAGSHPGGTGQGTTTREFGTVGSTLYAGGGGGGGAYGAAGGSGGAGGGANGGADNVNGSNAVANTGGGGGGGGSYSGAGGNGGSGIVIIRDHR